MLIFCLFCLLWGGFFCKSEGCFHSNSFHKVPNKERWMKCSKIKNELQLYLCTYNSCCWVNKCLKLWIKFGCKHLGFMQSQYVKYYACDVFSEWSDGYVNFFFWHLACLSLIRVSPWVLMQRTMDTYLNSLCRRLSHNKQ